MNKQLAQNCLEISDILLEICDFLPFKDLIRMMSTSSSFYKTINLFFQKFLIRSQTISKDTNLFPSSNKNHLIFAQHFCKRVLRFSLRPNHFNIQKNTFNYSAEMRYLKRKVKDIREVYQYTCLLFEDKRLIIEENIKEIPHSNQIKHAFEDVEQFQLNQKCMLLLKNDGQFTISFFNNFQEKRLNASDIQGKALNFKLTENFLVVLTKSSLEEKKDYLEAYFLDVDEFDERDESHVIKPAKLVFPDSFDQIITFSISNKTGYFVSQNNELFEVDLSNLRKKLELKRSDLFKEQKIVKVFSGESQNFAIELKEIKSFAEFSNEEVVRAVEKIGFDDYLKIFKYSKVKGKDLYNCSDEFLKNNFGLKNHTLLQALRSEMKKNEKHSSTNVLWFWGDNKNKQFSFPKNTSKIILKPEILQIPKSTYEDIEEIRAFNDVVYLIGNCGSIWSTKPKDCHPVSKDKKGMWMDVWVAKDLNKYSR